MSNGFLLRPRENGRNRRDRMVCRVRDSRDESYRHCGCEECRWRRDSEGDSFKDF